MVNAPLCNSLYLFLSFLCHPYILTLFVEKFYYFIISSTQYRCVYMPFIPFMLHRINIVVALLCISLYLHCTSTQCKVSYCCGESFGGTFKGVGLYGVAFLHVRTMVNAPLCNSLYLFLSFLCHPYILTIHHHHHHS